MSFNKWDVYNGEKLIMAVEWNTSLKIEKYNIKLYDKDNLYLSALVVLNIILLGSYHA